MPGRPQLRPQKGWRFRLLICAADGIVECDDFNLPSMAPAVGETTMRDLLARFQTRQSVPTEE